MPSLRTCTEFGNYWLERPNCRPGVKTLEHIMQHQGRDRHMIWSTRARERMRFGYSICMQVEYGICSSWHTQKFWWPGAVALSRTLRPT